MARCVILGNGGHAAVLRSVFQEYAVLTDNDDDVEPDDLLIIGLGDMQKRREKFEKFRGHKFPDVIHPSVYGLPSLGTGVQLMAGVIVQPYCYIGSNVLINTGAQIDHDCVINAHTIIGPGAILCGDVHLGEACEIGAGAIIVQGVSLVAETKIPAGSLVVAPDDIRRPRRI